MPASKRARRISDEVLQPYEVLQPEPTPTSCTPTPDERMLGYGDFIGENNDR